MKRFIALFLILISILSIIGIVNAAPEEIPAETIEPISEELLEPITVQIMDFKDVNDTMWFYDAVQYVYFHNLMSGTAINKFAPEENVSRAMIVQVLYNLSGKPTVENKEHPFTDVEAGAWYEDAVVWAYQNKVVNGISETKAAPEDDVTREQLVTILYRTYQSTHENESVNDKQVDKFPDAADISDYAKEAMNWAIGKGFISGSQMGDKLLLDPNGVTTRAQLATIMQRYYQKTTAGNHRITKAINYNNGQKYYWGYYCPGCDKTFYAIVPMQEFQPITDVVKSCFEDWGLVFDTSLNEMNSKRTLEIEGIKRLNGKDFTSYEEITDTLIGYGYGRIWSCGVWGPPDQTRVNWVIGYNFETDSYTFTLYYV